MELREKRGKLGELHSQYESTEKLGSYKSKFYEDILSAEKEQKEQAMKEKLEKIKMAEKKGSYAKYVKEMYWP